MLEQINPNRFIDKEEYKKQIEPLQIELGKLQREAKDAELPVMIVFEGWDAAGKGTLINKLILPLDPRGFEVHSTQAPSEEERLRPFLWRFWIKTPAKGRIGIFDRSWYERVLEDALENKYSEKQIHRDFDEINAFERELADDGTLIIKFFLHISKKEQKKRFQKLEKDPALSWKVTKEDWKHHRQYERYALAADRMLSKTESENAPWTIVESHDRRFATLKIFNTVINAVKEKLKVIKPDRKKEEKAPILYPSLETSFLDSTDLSKSYDAETYRALLKESQKRIRELEHMIYKKRIPIMVLYEGWDAAGKGGNIRRLTSKLDPRGYDVTPIAAPNDIEKRHHYLWRFWTQVPKAGHIEIFDRTWYGRVLVERIEGFATEKEWKRAYREINEMERSFANFGTVIVKFWLHISPEVQLERFNERQNNPEKQWKITDEDWRNREKWKDYKAAVDEMILRTSTPYAPWTVVEANSKYYARIKALKTVIEAIGKAL